MEFFLLNLNHGFWLKLVENERNKWSLSSFENRIIVRKVWFSSVKQRNSCLIRFPTHLYFVIPEHIFLPQFNFLHIVKYPWKVEAECIIFRVNYAGVLRHAWLNLNMPKFLLIKIHVSNESFCRKWREKAGAKRCSVRKAFLENSQNSQENNCSRDSFLIKLQRPTTLRKKRLWHRCFLVNFVKFLRTPFLTEHIWWLLLEGKVTDTKVGFSNFLKKIDLLIWAENIWKLEISRFTKKKYVCRKM